MMNKAKKLKIGFLSPYLDTFGGGERYILTLASHFSKDHSVDIFWDDSKIKAPLSRFLKINLTNINFKKNIFNSRSINKALSTKKYDVIFILSDGSIPFTLAKKNILHFQVPFVFSNVSKATKFKLSMYNSIVCNSYFTKKFIDSSFKIDSKVIYPPVDTSSLRVGKKEKIILSVGRFSKDQLHPKKQEVLIEVFKELYKKNPDWRLYLVGQAKKHDIKYLRNLKKTVRGFGIRIQENLDSTALRNLYASSSIYWHATGFGEDENKNPERMEHFGIATVEAMSSGAVPVVIAYGGQKEIVIDNKNGLLWSTKSELFGKTQELMNNDERLKIFSKKAIESSRKFSKENFFKQYEQIIF